MKRMALGLMSVFCFVLASWSQGPVTWKYTAKKIADKTYEVRILANVDEEWHIYSKDTPEGGPRPTTVSFVKNPALTMDGKMKEEGDMEIYYEKVFKVDVYAYTDKVEFVQIVKLKSGASKSSLFGSIEYMACTKGQCLPPETIHFTLALE